MKFALPVKKWNSWDSHVSEHFGHSDSFAIVDCDLKTISHLNTIDSRLPSECAPLHAIKGAGCEAVVCRHLGKGALARCHQYGLKVLWAKGETVMEVTRNLELANLSLPDSELCTGGHTHCSHL